MPSIFHHKVFKTTNFDHTSEVLNEVSDNQQEHKDGSDSETLQLDSAETTSFTVSSNQSVLDTSILLHDYCGYIDTSTLSQPKNQFTQTDVLQKESVGIQTSESYSDLSENNDVSFNTTCDKTTSTIAPFLTIEDLKQDISFYTGLPNKETFYILFEHLSVYYKCEVSEVLGGRPKN